MKKNHSFSLAKIKSKPAVPKILHCLSTASSNSRCSSSTQFPAVSKDQRITASSYCILDSQTDWVLSSRRDFEIREIASLTKIMTAHTVIQLVNEGKVSYSDTVKVSKEAAAMQGTSANLEENDEISVIDLLFALMLPSGNDAAWALAEHCGKKLNGSVSNFVLEMNKNCKKIGLFYTFFRNPHGMSTSKNLSTARDVCKMAKFAMQDAKFAEVVGTKIYSAYMLNEGRVKGRIWRNTNKMLEKGYLGVKTGITQNAGPCLCSALGNIIITILNSCTKEDRWRETEVLLNSVQL